MPESTIYTALLAFQADPPELVKSSSNPGFRGSKYVPLEQVVERVVPRLNSLGVVVEQTPVFIGSAGQTGLRTTFTHAASDTAVSGTLPLILDKVTPQGQGSAITYARRYALLSMLALVGDVDDDANAAMGVPQTNAAIRQSNDQAMFGPSL